MPSNLTQIYTEHLISAVIENNTALAKKMIQHGAQIFSQKSDDADALYICLDLAHLDMLDTILESYLQLTKWSEKEKEYIPSYLFQNYFQRIFKEDNVQALSILDKHGVIDFAMKHQFEKTHQKQEQLTMSDMMKVGATQCILYCYDKLPEVDWITALSSKIRNDLTVSTYDNQLLPIKEHATFIQSMKNLNPEGFQLALANALFSMKDTLYLERPDKPSFLYLMTNYFNAGLNLSEKLVDIDISYINEGKRGTYLKDLNAWTQRNRDSVMRERPEDTFMSMIKYDETKIAIEKWVLENATHSVQSDQKKTLKI